MIANGIKTAGVRKMPCWCHALRVSAEVILSGRIIHGNLLGESSGAGEKSGQNNHGFDEPFNSHAVDERASNYRPVKINSCKIRCELFGIQSCFSIF